MNRHNTKSRQRLAVTPTVEEVNYADRQKLLSENGRLQRRIRDLERQRDSARDWACALNERLASLEGCACSLCQPPKRRWPWTR